MAQVFQINLSNGGVPKLAVPFVRVKKSGLEGDAHHDLRHHGGEERAVCLYALERILDLQAEGHPIYPGSIGENLTLLGVDWNRLRTGIILRFQGRVEIELTRPTTPCRTIAASFKDGAIERVLHGRYPGWSRWYARVLHEGQLRIGESVEVLT